MLLVRNSRKAFRPATRPPADGTGSGSSAAVTARGVHRGGEGELIRFQLDTPVGGSAKLLICD